MFSNNSIEVLRDEVNSLRLMVDDNSTENINNEQYIRLECLKIVRDIVINSPTMAFKDGQLEILTNNLAEYVLHGFEDIDINKD